MMVRDHRGGGWSRGSSRTDSLSEMSNQKILISLRTCYETAGGRLVLGIFAALAEFERELIARERSRGSLRRAPVVATAAVPTR